MSTFRHIAPSGTPIRLKALLAWAERSLSSNASDNELTSTISTKYGIKHCFTVSTGRAAMVIALRAFKAANRAPQRTEVIIPSYTCYSVAASAELAGLKVRICDIDPKTLSYDIDQLKTINFDNVLAIVTANLYGLPNDLPEIERLAKNNGIYMLDDAAQSMNGKIAGRYAGTYGDIGLYSLDKGKNITTIQGGILVTNSDQIAELIKNTLASLQPPSRSECIKDFIKLTIYTILLRPWLYWIPAKMPGLGLGQTEYTTDYPISLYNHHMKGLAEVLFNDIDTITSTRKNNYQRLQDAAAQASQLQAIQPINTAEPAYLRLPIIFDTNTSREAFIKLANKHGISATISYPQSLADLSEIQGFATVHNDHAEGGRFIASHIVTIPTHGYMSDRDIDSISNLLVHSSNGKTE